MEPKRIKTHPIFPVVDREVTTFYWNDLEIQSYVGDTISSAMIANGIKIFGYHAKDYAPIGIFCSNGQ